MENRRYNTVITVLKSNWKIVETKAKWNLQIVYK